MSVVATCEKCQGIGARAAESRTFVCEGHNLRCLAFVSSCVVCGHRWEDQAYQDENFQQVRQTCKAAACRLAAANGPRLRKGLEHCTEEPQQVNLAVA